MAVVPTDVTTTLVFLRRESIHLTDKPYKLQYDPGNDLPRTNCVNEGTNDITIHDFRGKEEDFTLERQGFAVRSLRSKLEPDEFLDDDKVKSVYYDELKELVKRELGAKRVEVLEHGIRKRHAQFPISTGKDYDHLQPTSVVHIDFTPDSALQASEQVLLMNPKDYQRVQCLNVWKPLRGPVTDWPLAVCDARTVNIDEHCMATDVVTRTGFTENYQIYPSHDYKWYYLNNQLAEEVILFRQTDTDEAMATGVPHAGFRNPKVLPNERPRESIEARVFAYY